MNTNDGNVKHRVIDLPRGEKYITDFNSEDIYRVCCDFCGEDFAAGVAETIEDLQDRADYETFRNTLQEIESLLQQYENKVERGQRFTRVDVFKLFDEIHKLIGDVI